MVRWWRVVRLIEDVRTLFRVRCAMDSLALTKLIESRSKTVAMLEERITTLKAEPAYAVSTTLQGVVKVSEQRLTKVRKELAELRGMREADSRQVEMPGTRKK